MGTAVWWYKIEVDFLFWVDDWVALNFTCFLHRFQKKAVVPPNFQPQELGIDINKTPENLMYDHEDAPPLHSPFAFDSGNRWSSVGATVKSRGSLFRWYAESCWTIEARELPLAEQPEYKGLDVNLVMFRERVELPAPTMLRVFQSVFSKLLVQYLGDRYRLNLKPCINTAPYLKHVKTLARDGTWQVEIHCFVIPEQVIYSKG